MIAETSDKSNIQPEAKARKKIGSSESSKNTVENIQDVNEHEEEMESDTDSSSSSGASEYSLDDIDDDSEMPLLKYARILGSLPRSIDETNNNAAKPLSHQCKCSTLGRVTMTPGVGLSSDSSYHGTSLNMESDAMRREEDLLQTTRTQSFYVFAMATNDGSIHIIDPRTGIHICNPTLLNVHSDPDSKLDIVSLSFDASGTYLAALTSDGDVAIYEFRFGITTKYDESEVSAGSNSAETLRQTGPFIEKRPELKAFDSFLSRLAGEDWKTNATNVDDGSAEPNLGANDDGEPIKSKKGKALFLPVPSLKVTHPICTARFSLKSTNIKFSKATSICIDPAYKRKREKSVLVGFENGRILLSKRSGHGGTIVDSSNFGGVVGNLLQPKRNDIELYQGPTGSSGYKGIECIAWRGSIASWADSSGIRIFDTDNMNRISQIDRPTGARVSLYPGISSLSPSLVFERSDSLLVSWGDCLMNLVIENVLSKTKLSQGSNKQATYKIKLAMAWKLDCVACDVVPIDSEHVAILGLVPKEKCDIELQVISRTNGTVLQSDIIPLIEHMDDLIVGVSTSDFALSSSFCTSRMQDSFEAEEEEYINDEDLGVDIQNMLNGNMATTLFIDSPSHRTFINPHLKWNLSLYKDDICSELKDDDDVSCSSDVSEYSDDYTFLLRPKAESLETKAALRLGPIMVITSRHDAVLIQTRDVDDSIEHARTSGNHGLALRRALDHRRSIRRHNLDDLIDEYFSAILCQFVDNERNLSLTIRRLQIAAKATEILFGGNVKMWDKWINRFAQIPGGLFLLRLHIPTRDPKLPHTIYETTLMDLFNGLENMYNKKHDHQRTNDIIDQIEYNATDLFLEVLRAWGPLSSLRDRLKLHNLSINHERDEETTQDKLFHEAEAAFLRRMKQSAENYLQCSPVISHDESDNLAHSIALPTGSTFDSLFDIETMLSRFREKIEGIQLENEQSRLYIVILEVLAEISFMKGCYKESLYYFLDLANYGNHSGLLNIDDEAIESLTETGGQVSMVASTERYKHILTMIETYDLHRVLLKKRPGGRSNVVKDIPPLVSLIHLVGLKDSGNFIIQHCTQPRSSKPPASSANESRSDLPINHVAAQLNTYPKLLYWFLERIIYEKPEIYVQFPNTAVPPSSVTDLHRLHFNLHVKYADRSFDESKKLTSIPTFEEQCYESPLLRFLKAALPHGGIRSDDIRSSFENCRKDPKDNGTLKFPHLFAHELAYVIEQSGSISEEDAKKVLLLYLEGVVSLPLAVEYVQRQTSLTSILWETLVNYCLDAEMEEEPSSRDESGKNGELFGSLLEVAARSGADLAHLVSKIPIGMSIQGIRAKLVSAISDYRFKLKINEDAAKIFSDDKISLLREQCHRSRRGVRIDLMRDVDKDIAKYR